MPNIKMKLGFGLEEKLKQCLKLVNFSNYKSQWIAILWCLSF